MKQSVRFRNINELFQRNTCGESMRNKINCIPIDYQDIGKQFSSAIFLNASVAILVLSGTGKIYINYRFHPVAINSMILLSASHLFNFSECSIDFKCLCLLVSKEFAEEMDSTDMIHKRIKYGVKLFNTPVLQLDNSNVRLLYERISALDKVISTPEHLYYKEMILNALFAFYLDLSNIIDRASVDADEGNPTRYESIIKSFTELLVNHYRKEHKVEFYASQLNISAHYLSLIVKRITGQSVCDFIFEMLYSEARSLLTYSKLSIQEITTRLNFADQSSFGKFFKRKAGVSPNDYRKMQS